MDSPSRTIYTIKASGLGGTRESVQREKGLQFVAAWQPRGAGDSDGEPTHAHDLSKETTT